LRSARIFKLENGSFNPATSILASVPLLLMHGVSYRLEAKAKAKAEGNRLRVNLDGVRLMDVTDSSMVSGKVGLNAFDGPAAYQDVTLTALP
jgi:levanbiose-producing levanase